MVVFIIGFQILRFFILILPKESLYSSNLHVLVVLQSSVNQLQICYDSAFIKYLFYSSATCTCTLTGLLSTPLHVYPPFFVFI